MARSDLNIKRFEALCVRLLRWGWPNDLAKSTAARIAARHADDDRRACAECAYYRPALQRCTDHRRAGLVTAHVGRDLASLHQRCDGFRAKAEP